MTENIENLVLEHLRLLRNDIQDLRKETRDGFARAELRLGVIESRTSAIEARLADLETGTRQRLELIESRLDLAD